MKDRELCRIVGCKNLRPLDKNGNMGTRLCNMHSNKKYRYGSPYADTRRAPNGTGTLNNGYKRYEINGRLEYAQRLIWQKTYGDIPVDCIIHHLDGNKLNNDLFNLQVMTRAEHRKLHVGLDRAPCTAR